MTDRKRNFYKTNLMSGGDDQDDEEMEQFDVEQDYEGGVFGQDGEFYYKEQKNINKRNKFTKEDAIYGSFMNTHDYFEDRDFSKGKLFGIGDTEAKGTGKNFNVPIAFVKSKANPIQQPKKEAAVQVKSHFKFPQDDQNRQQINQTVAQQKKSVRFSEQVHIKEFHKDPQDFQMSNPEQEGDQDQSQFNYFQQQQNMYDSFDDYYDEEMNDDNEQIEQIQIIVRNENLNIKSSLKKKNNKIIDSKQQIIENVEEQKTKYKVKLPQKRTFQEAEEMNKDITHIKQKDEEDKNALPVYFGKKGSRNAQKQQNDSKDQIENQKEKKQMENVLSTKYGKGLKILQAVSGYKVGQGIGKSNQGIINPVETLFKKDNVGLGGNSQKGQSKEIQEKQEKPNILDVNKTEQEKKVEKAKQQKIKLDKEDSEFLNLLKISKNQGKVPTIKSKGALSSFQVNTQKATVINDSIGSMNQGLKIIDMRGSDLDQKHQQIISDLRDLKQNAENLNQNQRNSFATQTPQAKKSEKFRLFQQAFEFKEKQKHQLQTVINKKNFNESQLLQLKVQHESIQEQLLQTQEKKVKLELFKKQLALILQNIKEKGYENNMEEHKLERDCTELYHRYTEFYVQYKVSLMIIKLIAQTKLKQNIQNWDILNQPLNQFDEFYRIRNILTIGKLDHHLNQDLNQSMKSQSYLSRYDVGNSISQDEYIIEDVMYWLFDTFWMHPVRTFINTRWNMREFSSEFAECLKKWQLLIPEKFFIKLIQMYIKPKIKREIQDWNPKDTNKENLLQNWLFPWKDLLSEVDMQSLIVQIKLKLTTALSEWKVESNLALILIQPLNEIMDMQSINNIVMRSVIPKLTFKLKEFQIDPANQDIDLLTLIFQWVGVIDNNTMINILRENLFSKWIGALDIWLKQVDESTDEESDDVLEEISLWYQGWKSFIPEQLKDNQQVQDIFRLAIQMIDSKV
ncbi:tuftelin-interacting protein 11 [Stylonychia lemnae]|uniref:Tuftelin-interacting protein 11 n=1 Tax=Stylonychia lemnae TaxID=5949 RepID=A0A077ZVV2_STYLE|nr:tuftelin-interacting protein 11 [Stylonychia lemnae]|eukprot:CDW72566.1 tuftelin-interacting protein 11 [Stylonychia lemnae]